MTKRKMLINNFWKLKKKKNSWNHSRNQNLESSLKWGRNKNLTLSDVCPGFESAQDFSSLGKAHLTPPVSALPPQHPLQEVLQDSLVGSSLAASEVPARSLPGFIQGCWTHSPMCVMVTHRSAHLHLPPPPSASPQAHAEYKCSVPMAEASLLPVWLFSLRS